ncbi:hypothetical protein N7603_08120 [Acholeplasma vituli]|uniref:Uncharacterized protein n=1 Tax=Paracholeplasma vituli TaxID=69473 RepID=A0ABT2Q137_9MOLU|nr:hypothetical protein [Paracholeplasma vituli]MCU0105623.1 hypothetical protein [Paracholeplasma vituli]
MNSYKVLKSALYESIILSLLKRNIISLNEAIGCLDEIDKDNKTDKDLNKETIMVKQKGLTNYRTGKSDLEDSNHG